MKTFGGNGWARALAVAFVLILAACGNNNPLPPINPNPNPGGFVPTACGPAGGIPISRDGMINYYSNLYSYSYGYPYYGNGYSQSTMNLTVGYVDAVSNNIIGGAQLYLDNSGMYGPTGTSSTQVCVNSRDPQNNQLYMGTGYPVSDGSRTYFVVNQLTMKGVMQLPVQTYYNPYMPQYPQFQHTSVTVSVGSNCGQQSYIDVTNRKYFGCVTLLVSGGQPVTYIAQ